MSGYCSNSPVRCENARQLTTLNSQDGNCPLCGLALVRRQDVQDSSRLEYRFLYISLVVMIIGLILLTYVYFSIKNEQAAANINSNQEYSLYNHDGHFHGETHDRRRIPVNN